MQRLGEWGAALMQQTALATLHASLHKTEALYHFSIHAPVVQRELTPPALLLAATTATTTTASSSTNTATANSTTSGTGASPAPSDGDGESVGATGVGAGQVEGYKPASKSALSAVGEQSAPHSGLR